MKIAARLVSPRIVELTCKPLLRAPFIVTLMLTDGTNENGRPAVRWFRASGREATEEMLDAIDCIDGGISAVTKGRS